LEWLEKMPPNKPWGIRSIPIVTSRYPLWDQEDFERDVDEGRFYLPDTILDLRETLVTSTIDARPEQCLRVPGPSFLPMLAAVCTGGVFIFGTYHWWWPAAISGLLSLVVIIAWLWTGTAPIPEVEERDVGLGVRLPIYVSGTRAVGWWAMLITMLGDMTAFISLVFGMFFYWTVHEHFPPAGANLPDWPGTSLALLLVLLSWWGVVLARRWNRRESAFQFYSVAGLSICGSALAGVMLALTPWRSQIDPTRHAFDAIVCVLILWTVLHIAVGILMLGYCMARRVAGRMTHVYDADIVNVTLYWHLLALTTAITVASITAFPWLTT
jgi:cytochrome c oxidase subunit I+III